MSQKTPASEKCADTMSELTKVWLLSCAHSLFLPILILGTQRFMPGRPMLSAAGPYSLLAGVLLAVPSIPMLRRYWRITRADGVMAAGRSEPIMVLRRRLMMGINVADLPALAGVLHYFLTRNAVQSLLLCATTVILVFLYRPVSQG